jgi:hypothetical protein
MSGSKYLAWCLSLALLIVAAVAAFNWFADPCGIYHYGGAHDWIHNRPALTDDEFIHKAHEVRVHPPDVIFLGNSRAAEGLDPHAPGVPANAYNLALHHSTIYEAWRNLQNACSVHTPQTVVIGIDQMWFAANLPASDAFSEDRLAVRADGRPTPWLAFHTAELGSTLFSLPTFYASLKALAGRPKLPYDAGYSENAPAVLEHMDQASRVLAANKKWFGDIGDLSMGDADKPGPQFGGYDAPQLDAFNHIVNLCAEKHIKLIVFVHPLHAALIDKLTNSWNIYKYWMKSVALKLESTPGLDSEFWDFSSYNAMSTEPFPKPTDAQSTMRFYWDGFHYHKIVGDMVLARIFGNTAPAQFGQLVTSANIDQDLDRLQAEKEAWHEHGQAIPLDTLPVPTPK